jgi:hypothetical protein
MTTQVIKNLLFTVATLFIYLGNVIKSPFILKHSFSMLVLTFTFHIDIIFFVLPHPHPS